jgi:hypothetical protein
LGTGHGALRNEMLFKDVLDLCPDLRPFGSGKLSDSFEDPTSDTYIQPTALFHVELGTVFPDTPGIRHGSPSINTHWCYRLRVTMFAFL